MYTIIIEDEVFQVTKKEYKKLDKMRIKVHKSKWPESDVLDEELNEYLDAAKKEYKYVGPVMFDWKR